MSEFGFVIREHRAFEAYLAPCQGSDIEFFHFYFREHKFYVKDFIYNEDNIQQEKGELTKLNQVSVNTFSDYACIKKGKKVVWVFRSELLNPDWVNIRGFGSG